MSFYLNRQRLFACGILGIKRPICLNILQCVGLSDAVGPDKLLWDSSFGNLAELTQEGSLLKVDVEAVSEAVMPLADQLILIKLKWVGHRASALLVARNGRLSDLLGKASRQVGLLDLLLLSLQLFNWNLGVLLHLIDTTY